MTAVYGLAVIATVCALLAAIGIAAEVERRRHPLVIVEVPVGLDPEVMRRIGVALGQIGDAMREVGPAVERSIAPLQRMADAIALAHRTAARPAHRAPRGERA